MKKLKKLKTLKSRERLRKFTGRQMIIMVTVVLRKHYPNFTELLDSIPDHRTRSTYQVSELIMAGLSIFIFKRGSRHNADLSVRNDYEKNYITLFGLRLPVMDTVNDFLKELPVEELEQIKKVFVTSLIKSKSIDKYKYNGLHQIAIDGTGLMHFEQKPFEGCPSKTSKNGVKTWYTYVVEAKIVCSNGFSFSMGTEWYVNDQNIESKQDCELKAFERLAKKIKSNYPRLPILILADGLYPNNTIFNICKANNWAFIFTFKDTLLTTVWDKLAKLKPKEEERTVGKDDEGWLCEKISFVNDLEYKEHDLNWLEYQKGYLNQAYQEKFTHISSMRISDENCWQMSTSGRLRWTIENEGFNTQKNQGYGLQHKFSRKHLGAMQNYYQLLQIAHIINQLTEKLLKVKQSINDCKTTIKSLWENVLASMQMVVIQSDEIQLVLEQNKQLRY